MAFKNCIFVCLAFGILNPPSFAKNLNHEDLAQQPASRAAVERSYQSRGWQPPAPPIRNIAEFEPMQGVLIAYPLGITHDVVKEIARDAIVYCITTQPSQVQDEFMGVGINMDNVVFINEPSNSYWTRDYGPWWVTDGNRKVSVVDFNYYTEDHAFNNAIPAAVADHFGTTVFKMPLDFAGGNYMTDGYHVSASTDQTFEKNPTLDEKEIGATLNEYLGIEKHHIIPDPLDTYINHIDTWGKFVAPDKVVIIELPQSHGDYEKLEAAADYFKNQTSSYGTPYKIYRLPASGATEEGYINGIIVNNKMFVPLAGTGNDQGALAVFEAALPGYRVIGFEDQQPIPWLSTDAIHCRTKGIPDLGMLYIGHIPLHDSVTSSGGGFNIEASIIPYSDEGLTNGKAQLYWSTVKEGPFTAVDMLPIDGDTYRGVIPTRAGHSDFYYYLQASDSSGRSESHPIPGSLDPHTFTGLNNLLALDNSPVINTDANLSITSGRSPGFVTINYELKRTAKNARLSIHTLSGRLLQGWNLNKARGRLEWNSLQSASTTGLVIFKLQTGNKVTTRQLQIIK